MFIVATALLTSGLPGGGGGGAVSGSQPDSGVVASPATDQPILKRSAPATAGGASAKESAPALAPPVAQGDLAARARDRQVERAASITLSAPRDRIEEVADGAIRVTDRHGGFVVRSSVTAGEGRNAGAILDLRLPSTRLQAALADLSDLGHVRSRTQDATDITAEFRSPRRRLSDAQAERRGLLRRLERAVTANETAAIRAGLRTVNRRIDRLQAELRRLRTRVSFASVSVTIEPGRAASGGGGGWSLGDAVDDALGVLRAVLGGVLVALAVLVPAAILGGLGWLAYRGWLRRRRESALEM
jgi:hypothetical protein